MLYTIFNRRDFMRIIAGKYRGLKLETFEADNIRPTLDRAREGIFNKIQFSVLNADCLDLFGGTGAISIEFVSRGANRVVTVDNNEKSCSLINRNFAKIKTKPNLIKSDYLFACDSLRGQKFDIIFLDPPFASDIGEKAIKKIIECELLSSDGIIIFEHSAQVKIDSPEFCENLNLEIFDSKKYGTIFVDYLKRV